MTRPANPDYTFTVANLCLSAALELGAVGIGGTLDSTEEAEMIKRLNSMLAKWSKDANLWRQESGTVTVPGGIGAGTLPSDVHDIRSARIVENSRSRVLAQWNRDEYFSLPNRDQEGTPAIFYFSRQIDGVEIYLWPIPPGDVTVELDYGRSFFFAESNSQELDIPEEWHEAALYGLAARCAGIFGATNIAPQTVARIDAQARQSYDRAIDADRPDSYVFEYDSPVEAS